MRLCTLLPRVLLALWLALPLGAWSADEFLPPEKAFRFEARAVDARHVEVAFKVAEGYYLYREPFKFVADGDVKLGAAQVPAGKIKFDETFQKNVETYRSRVVIRIPVESAPASFKLTVTSQGCADAGLCYPPMPSVAEVRLAGFGGDGSVRVEGLSGTASSLAASPPSSAAAGRNFSSGDGAIDQAMRSGLWWPIVGVFFVAGLLLSFTPCVLPMLPILSSIIVGDRASQGQASLPPSRSRGLLLAATYSLGMALVYTALGIAAGLAGEGLAAAMQTPWVLGAFALLLAVLALSMFGFYELQLPSGLRDRLSASSGKLQGGKLAGVFAMGGLSALIVSPCVAAPLAGALLYISQTRDVALGGSALFFLAAGMSVPLMLVGSSAGMLLPKSGAWMDSVKRFFGLLLLGVAWWTVSPVLPAALVVAGWGVLLIGMATFMGAFDRLHETAGVAGRLTKAAGLALGIAGAAQIIGATAGADDPLQPLHPLTRPVAAVGTRPTAPYAAATLAPDNSPAEPKPPSSAATAAQVSNAGFQRVASVEELDTLLRTSARPVLLDFYADWCVSCKEMERFTFSDEGIRQRLAGTLLLQADVTRNTDADRALLKRFGLFGPPGIVFFDATGRELGQVRVIGYQNPKRFGQSLQAAGL